MTISPGRVPPADPMTSRSPTSTATRGGSTRTAPETWHVSADIYDDSGTHVDAHAGDFHIVTVDIYDTRDPFGLLDGEDADLGLIAETIFSTGALTERGAGRPFPSRSRWETDGYVLIPAAAAHGFWLRFVRARQQQAGRQQAAGA